jgi:transposase
MEQLHRRLTDEQIRLIIKNYCEGQLTRAEVQETLGVSKSRFFVLLKIYRQDPAVFSVSYQRHTPGKLTAEAESTIREELKREKKLVEDKELPISSYNYSALRDRLKGKGIAVSLPTIIKRAKEQEAYQPKRKGKIHDREVVTTAIGALIQHDASTHLWSPFAKEKWTLITSIDDYSRKLLFADFVTQETSWAHIQAAQVVMKAYGLPLSYYVDNLRVFRFVQNRDTTWRKYSHQTDDIDPQWRQVMRLLKVNVTYALSPQAKGKVERPYRWLQDRIVRTCALENLTSLEEVRGVLRDELDRYNNHQVHSTTGEIPSLRFENARKNGNSFFRPFSLPKPYTSPKDVFCLHESRIVDGYGRISLYNIDIKIPHAPLHEDVELHLVPDLPKNALEVRIWFQAKMYHSLTIPLEKHLSTFDL